MTGRLRQGCKHAVISFGRVQSPVMFLWSPLVDAVICYGDCAMRRLRHRRVAASLDAPALASVLTGSVYAGFEQASRRPALSAQGTHSEPRLPCPRGVSAPKRGSASVAAATRQGSSYNTRRPHS